MGDKWCSDKITFYAGGPVCGFAGIAAAGAMNAIRDTGVDAEIIYSDLDGKWFVIGESVGLGVDAAMMGHPGDEAYAISKRGR